jgi:hypothetical protein
MTADRRFGKLRWGRAGVLVSCAVPGTAPSVAQTAPVSRVKDIRFGPNNSYPRLPTDVNGAPFFNATRLAILVRTLRSPPKSFSNRRKYVDMRKGFQFLQSNCLAGREYRRHMELKRWPDASIASAIGPNCPIGPFPPDILHLVRTSHTAIGRLTSTSRNLQSKQTINDSWFIQEPA